MIERFPMIALVFIGLSLCAFSTSAQNADPQECRGPLYTRKEVTKPAKMTDQLNFKALYEAFGKGVSGEVKLEAVLCRSGRITDIRVIDSRPPKIGEYVAAALSLVRFKPAEMNWHTVSQRQQFEFNINGYGVSAIDSAAAAGRLVEELDIIGHRRMTKEQILTWIKTRPGEMYSADQIQKDLTAILATGYFNAMGTRVTLDGAIRGGVCVSFEVAELPLISEIRFEGLKEADQFTIVEELRRQNLNVRKGAPFDPVNLKKAARLIEQFFQSQGWVNVKAEALTENITPAEVKVVFKISGRNL